MLDLAVVLIPVPVGVVFGVAVGVCGWRLPVVAESADVNFGLFLASKLELVLVSVVGGVGVECRSVGGVLV